MSDESKEAAVGSSPEPRVREADIIWAISPKDSSQIVGYWGRMIVFPSTVGQSAPDESCYTRKEPAVAATMERCELFLNPRNRRNYLAYPSNPPESVAVPGIIEPEEIRFNAEGIYTLTSERFRYIRIFPGANDKMGVFPKKDQATPWPNEKPSPGDTVRCWINYFSPDPGVICGYAYPAIANPPSEEIGEQLTEIDRFWIYGHVVVLVRTKDKNYNVTAAEDPDGTIHLTMTPRDPMTIDSPQAVIPYKLPEVDGIWTYEDVMVLTRTDDNYNVTAAESPDGTIHLTMHPR